MRVRYQIAVIAAIVLAAVAISVLFAAAWPRIQFYQLTGRFTPIEIVDTLQSPVTVTGWSEEGLRLSGGRVIQLPGFHKLPMHSTALTEVTKRGVELGADGRVFGLVRVWHWCGNDPVREHITRVDIADMMMFLREGEWATPPSSEALAVACRTPGGRFSERGWNMSEFSSFRLWHR